VSVENLAASRPPRRPEHVISNKALMKSATDVK